MGRTAIPHIVLAIAAIIAATVLFALGHTDPGYALLGVAGVGGVAGAAVTIPAGAPGTVDPPPALGPIMRMAAAALADTQSPGAGGSAGPAAGGVIPAPPAATDVPPPPAPVVTP